MFSRASRASTNLNKSEACIMAGHFQWLKIVNKLKMLSVYFGQEADKNKKDLLKNKVTKKIKNHENR